MQIDRFSIDGAEQLDKRLQQLGKEVATDIGVEAVSASAAALAARWVNVAPYDIQRDPERKYGHLKDEIKFSRVGTDNPNVIAYSVTTGRAFWAHFYEFGTVNQPPRPTFRPATDSMKDELVNIQIEHLRAGIQARAA